MDAQRPGVVPSALHPTRGGKPWPLGLTSALMLEEQQPRGPGGQPPPEGNYTGTHHLERSFSEGARSSRPRVLSALVRRQAIPRGPRWGQGAVGSSEEAVELGLQVVPHLAHLEDREEAG